VFFACRFGERTVHPEENNMRSAARNASHAVDQIKETVSSARSSLVDLGVQGMKFLDAVRSQEERALDSALEHIGLQRRQSSLRPMLFFVTGAIVAGSIALILAPASGKKVRAKILELLGATKDADVPKMGPQDLQSVGQRVDGILGGSNIGGASRPVNGTDQRSP
jgi:hypothetical protein